MATKPALSRQASAAAPGADAEVVRHDDLRFAPAGISPASILNIGPRPGQSHFAAQLAPDGAPSIETRTQYELAAGFDSVWAWGQPTAGPWMTPNALDTAVQMRTSVGGPITPGSQYARSELRELDQVGNAAGWDAKDAGTHRLRVRFRITKLPTAKPEIVVAQGHNGTTDRIAVRTQLVSGTVRLRVRVNGASVTLDSTSPINPSGADIVNGAAGIVGVEFELIAEIINGTLRIYLARTDGTLGNLTTPIVTSTALVSTGGPTWYWKTGCYLQSAADGSDGDALSDWGAVELRDLSHWHTGWPAATRHIAVAQHAEQHAPGGLDDLSGAYVRRSHVAAPGQWDAELYGDIVSTAQRDDCASQLAMSATIRTLMVILGRVPAGQAIAGVRMARTVAAVGGAASAALFSSFTLGTTAWEREALVTPLLTGTGVIATAAAVAAKTADRWYALQLVLTTAPTTYPSFSTTAALPAAVAALVGQGAACVVAGSSTGTAAPGTTLNPTTGWTPLAQKPWAALY